MKTKLSLTVALLLLLLNTSAGAGGPQVQMPRPWEPGMITVKPSWHTANAPQPTCYNKAGKQIPCLPRCQDGDDDQSHCMVVERANSRANEIKSRLPDTSFQIINHNHDPVLTIQNYNECEYGKVRCLISLDPTWGVVVEPVQPDCLATMEQAMRGREEMERLKRATGWPTMEPEYWPDTRTPAQKLAAREQHLKLELESIQQERKDNSRIAELQQLWAEAKRCWHKP